MNLKAEFFKHYHFYIEATNREGNQVYKIIKYRTKDLDFLSLLRMLEKNLKLKEISILGYIQITEIFYDRT